MEWSPDSCYVLTGNYKRCVAEVWSIEDPEWRCKIDEGSAGLLKICWSPDSRHILTTAEFHVSKTYCLVLYMVLCSKELPTGGVVVAGRPPNLSISSYLIPVPCPNLVLSHLVFHSSNPFTQVAIALISPPKKWVDYLCLPHLCADNIIFHEN